MANNGVLWSSQYKRLSLRLSNHSLELRAVETVQGQDGFSGSTFFYYKLHKHLAQHAPAHVPMQKQHCTRTVRACTCKVFSQSAVLFSSFFKQF